MTAQKYHYSSKLILIAGFAFVVLIMGILTITWTIHVFESKQNIKVIFGEQKQSRLLVTMRDVARRRAIYLHRMAMLKDPFARDEEYMKFNAAATEFIVARDTLLSMEGGDSKEVEIWNKARPFIVEGAAIQKETAELLLQDRTKEANTLLLQKVIPIQNKVNDTLSEMFIVQKDLALKAYEAAIARNERIYWIAVLSGMSAILLTVFIAFIVVRRAAQAEATLDEARVAAQTATQLKSQFLANMSHEIRTPLTAVIGYADTLLGKNINQNEREYSATRILNNGKHLLHIINDILDISKIEAGQLSIEKLQVSQTQILLEIDSLIGDEIRDKGLEFNTNCHFPLPEKIKTDPTKLKQILLNLLGNAKKFTESGSITLDVKYLEDSGKMQYEVLDTGVGLTEQEQARLFNAFTQADESTTRKFGGTGLGLYISRQLAQLLGGDITCSSEKGRGSRFSVVIDANVQPGDSLIDSLRIELDQSNNGEWWQVPALSGKVIVAEDNPDNQRLISLYIQNTGAEVVVVDNGQAAIENAVADTYDLIMMDIQMPVMGGAEAVKWLRQVGNQTPIVMLTANAMREEKDRCLKLGANDLLTKPIDKQAFYDVLAKFLRHGARSASRARGDNNEQMERLINDFVASLPAYKKSIQDALDARKIAEIRSIVHQLKGAGGNFGFPHLTNISEVAELSMVNEGLEQSLRFIDDVLTCIGQIIDTHKLPNCGKKLGT